MAFYSWFGVFGLTLAVAPAVVFIPKDSQLDLAGMTVIDADYDEDEYDLEKAKQEFEKVRKKMDDYSFRIFLPCHLATGWILDYEIPKNGGYPMKWYIATNAHVANKFRFDEDSPWKDLPNEPLGKDEKYLGSQDLQLGTIDSSCVAAQKEGYFDFNLSRQSNGETQRSNYGAIKNGKMKAPKLFYVPIDFLEKNENLGVKENNFRDFAVIEVEFTNLDYAKALTSQFYENYPIGSIDAINVFAPSLNEQKSWDEIDNLYENFYSLGYSYKDNWFSYEHNFEEKDGIASLLSQAFNDRQVRGHVNAPEFDARNPEKMVEWKGKKLNSLGYFYSLDFRSMSGGASGGLVVDKNGNVLGIRSLGSEEADISLIVPLRSTKVVKDGVFVSPAYDLILGGVDGQKTSYRQQVEAQGIQTYLSSSGWKHLWNSRANLTRSSCLGTGCFHK